MDWKRTFHPVDFRRTMRLMKHVVAVVAENKSHRDPRNSAESFVLGRFECAPRSMLLEDPRHPDARLLVSNTQTRVLPRIVEAEDARKNILLLKFWMENIIFMALSRILLLNILYIIYCENIILLLNINIFEYKISIIIFEKVIFVTSFFFYIIRYLYLHKYLS